MAEQQYPRVVQLRRSHSRRTRTQPPSVADMRARAYGILERDRFGPGRVDAESLLSVAIGREAMEKVGTQA